MLVDLWNDTVPALGLNNTAEHCAGQPYPIKPDGEPNLACTYEDDLFLSRVKSIIMLHDIDTPLFLFWAAHTIHAPLQVPKPWYDKYSHVTDDDRRRRYLAMVSSAFLMLWRCI